jgi:hypothetical protein
VSTGKGPLAKVSKWARFLLAKAQRRRIDKCWLLVEVAIISVMLFVTKCAPIETSLEAESHCAEAS